MKYVKVNKKQLVNKGIQLIHLTVLKMFFQTSMEYRSSIYRSKTITRNFTLISSGLT